MQLNTYQRNTLDNGIQRILHSVAININHVRNDITSKIPNIYWRAKQYKYLLCSKNNNLWIQHNLPKCIMLCRYKITSNLSKWQ